MAEGHSPLDHVVDHPTIEFPWADVELPMIGDFQITRFMVMEVVAALLIIAIIVPLARHIAKQAVTRGPLFNAFEAILLFLRDQVIRPAVGGGHDDHGHGHDHHDHSHDGHGHGADSHDHGAHDHGTHAPLAAAMVYKHPADKFLPLLWTLFFFVLFNNLLGLIPGGASATGNINVTAMLAVIVLSSVIIAGSRELGVAGFWLGIVPSLDVPKALKPFLWGLMFAIEVAGLFIKHIVLAVRLFANMMAGHIVLAVILGFILLVYNSPLFYAVMPASILGVVCLSMLELFVAFLQAYIFTFLSALFIGSAVHPH